MFISFFLSNFFHLSSLLSTAYSQPSRSRLKRMMVRTGFPGLNLKALDAPWSLRWACKSPATFGSSPRNPAYIPCCMRTVHDLREWDAAQSLDCTNHLTRYPCVAVPKDSRIESDSRRWTCPLSATVMSSVAYSLHSGAR